MRNFVRSLASVLMVAFAGLLSPKEACANDVACALKMRAFGEIEPRVRAATVEIVGEQWAKKYVFPVFDFFFSEECGLSKKDNMGLYVIYVPSEMNTSNPSISQEKQEHQLSSAIDGYEFVCVFKTRPNAPIKVIKNIIANAGMELKEVNGWMLASKNRQLLEDSALVESLLTDIKNKIKDDLVYEVIRSACEKLLEREKRLPDKLLEDLIRTIEAKLGYSLYPWEKFSMSLRCDALNVYFTEIGQTEKGSITAKRVNSLPKGKTYLYDLIPPKNVVARINACVNVSKEDVLTGIELADIIQNWIQSIYKNLTKDCLCEGCGAECVCKDSSECASNEDASKLALEKKCESDMDCNFEALVDVSVEVLELVKLLSRHMTGDSYFAITKFSEFCTFYGLQNDIFTEEPWEKDFHDTIAKFSHLQVKKMEDYGKFEIYEVVIEIPEVIKTLEKLGRRNFLAIDGGMCIGAFYAESVEKMRNLIDLYNGRGEPNAISFEDDVIAKGAFDLGQIVNMIDPSKSFANANLGIEFVEYAKNDTYIVKAKVRNSEIRNFIDVIKGIYEEDSCTIKK
ncbi:MAG: hypothetical protein LBF49_03810 [Puniceicoccales bacterium]|jgi:hypothetical protein|nr:hypothetical protein [Puniceicoccales bacterium]